MSAIKQNQWIHLDILFNNPEEELWKYYLVYSYRHSLIRIKKEAPEKIEKCIRNLYSFYKIPEEFYERLFSWHCVSSKACWEYFS